MKNNYEVTITKVRALDRVRIPSNGMAGLVVIVVWHHWVGILFLLSPVWRDVFYQCASTYVSE